ncbi:hypothetical protein M902_1255 [Bacteriovorax sp. BAL6_X]|uniref:hypothetical protein n=1 Tax=Bacteriovorax sp. BAL6_X TaxID=1201290 RepID=UPI0003856692|nr:hypothetical protein [Bacteriovorax sp. BAL6_X]EPZ52549.1 hypothetical protein M902_1255 [Bacteriovorax sp. BAL6_X]
MGKSIVLKQNGIAIEEHLTAAYIAFNTAVTANHIADWIWESISENKKKELSSKFEMTNTSTGCFLNYLKQVESIRQCREIANGSKHLVDKPSTNIKANIKWKTIPAQAGTLYAGGPLSGNYYSLYVEEDNKQINVMTIFENAYAYWTNFIESISDEFRIE